MSSPLDPAAKREHAEDCASRRGGACCCTDPRVFNLQLLGLPVPAEMQHLLDRDPDGPGAIDGALDRELRKEN